MGFYSRVEFVCEKKAFKKITSILKKYNLDYSEVKFGENHTIKIDWVKWYQDFPEVKEVEDVLIELDKHSDDLGCSYKMIILNEDNTSEERSNTYKYMDFFVEANIRNVYAGDEYE